MTHPELNDEEPVFEVPTITFEDPAYLKDHMLHVLVELENVFGQLRNADSETRLTLVEELLSESDVWLDFYYTSIGVTAEMRAKASEIELELIARMTEMLGFN